MKSARISLFSLISAAALMLLAPVAQANTLNVPSASFTTIQAAIDQATVGDPVVVAAGTYHEAIIWKKDLHIQGAGVGQTIIDPSIANGGPDGACITTSGLTSASRLEGFTLTHGENPWDSYYAWTSAAGGGMVNIDSNPVVMNCALIDNFAPGDTVFIYDPVANTLEIFDFNGTAGMYNYQSNPTVTACTISGGGGGLGGMTNVFSSPVVTGCVFTGNFCGMYNQDSSPSVTDCTLSGNSPAGMQNFENSKPTVTRCAFIGNSAPDGGGGMLNGFFSDAVVTNCTFFGNTVDGTNPFFHGGGAIANDNSNPTISNCLIAGNIVDGAAGNGEGGGISNFGSNPTITNCTIVGNRAGSYGGAIANRYLSSPAITNCIIWGNTAPLGANGINNVYSSAPVIRFSVVQDLPNGAPDASGNFAADPLFADTTNGDFRLQWGSPCIDAGDNSVVTSPPFLMDPTNSFIIDLMGNSRINRNGVDIGAYEYQNHAPTANAGSNQTVTVPHDHNPATNTASISLNGSVSSDPEGDGRIYQWKEGSAVLGTTATQSVNKPAGDYTFTLTVTDTYGASSSASVSVHVNPEPNGAPTLSVPATAAVNIGCPVTVQASAIDPDGDSITYSKTSGPAWATVSAAGAVTFNPPAGTVDVFTVGVKATDSYGASDQKNISVTVCPMMIESVIVSKKNGITTVQFNLRNTDGTIVNTVSLNSSTLKGIATSTAMPITFTQLKQGVSKSVQLKFNGVASGTAQFIVNGTSSAGPVNANMTVNVP